jgi:two-component system, NtrC family, sensor kinase
MLFRNRLSLRAALLIYLLAPLCLLIFFTGYLSIAKWEERVERRMQADLEMVARAIQLPLSHSMERRREGGVQQALKSALSIDSVYSAYAYNLEGRQVASAGKADPEPESPDKLARIAVEGERIGEYGRVAKDDVYSFFVPLKDSLDQTSGLLHLTRRREDFREYIGKLRRGGGVGFLLAIGVMSALVLIGEHQALGSHFRRISEGMLLVAAGDKEHRLPISGPQEIALISENFNKMLDSIQQAERKIRHQREHQRRLEERLRQAEKLAAIGRLAAGLAHELGSPLSIVSGVAQRSLSRTLNDSRLEGDFRRIQRAVGKMETIIRQLLDFSHRQKAQLRPVSPLNVIRASVNSISAEKPEWHGRVSVQLDDCRQLVALDPVRVERALVNLIRNALQSSADSRVWISCERDASHAIIAVDDNGPGIDEDIKPNLFEPFFTTKNVGSGTGLGLAVVHGIVEEHGGSVRLADSVRGGARFELRFPLIERGGGRR